VVDSLTELAVRAAFADALFVRFRTQKSSRWRLTQGFGET
jgi:hypothetical protein